jgi:hypothetical protein
MIPKKQNELCGDCTLLQMMGTGLFQQLESRKLTGVTHEAADSALYRQETPAVDLWPPVQNEISSEQVPNRKEIRSSSKVSNDMRLRERKRKQVSGSTPTNLNRVVGIKKCHEGSEEILLHVPWLGCA